MKRRFIVIIFLFIAIAIIGVIYKVQIFKEPISQGHAENIALEYAKEKMNQSYQVKISQRNGDNYRLRLYPIKTSTLNAVDITIDVYTGKVISIKEFP